MRKMEVVILCLSISVVLIFCFCVYAEPVEQSKISFSLLYNCETAKGDRTRCLTDGFKSGLNVVLVSKTRMCKARTAVVFTDKDHYREDFAATRLSVTEACFTAKDNEDLFTTYDIAVVGVNPEVVKLVFPKDDRSPVPKHIEAKARKLVISEVETPQDASNPDEIPVTVSKAQPKVLRVLRARNVTLLIFELLAGGTPWEPGPTVALINGEVFLLNGACTDFEPTFFSVNDKLYLTYMATVSCCGCGDQQFFVYDFSSGKPQMVYADATFVD